MIRLAELPLCVLLALLLSAGNARAQQTGQIEVTQVDANDFPKVTVYFRVLGPDGKQVPELRRDMLTLLESGAPTTITDFRGYGAFETRTILLVDTSGSMHEPSGGPGSVSRIIAARDACRAFVDVLRSHDQIGLTEFDATVSVVCPLGSDADTVRAGIDRLGPRGHTAWRDAVLTALETLSKQPGRRTILLLTDGQDNASKRSLADVAKRANDLQIPVHTIGMGRRENVDADALTRLAADTGGRFLIMPSAADLGALYQSLGKAVHDEVAVTYTSNRTTPDGTRRDVELLVNVNGATIRQSTEYLERHLLNVSSDIGIFAALLAIVALAYAIPLTFDRRQVAREARARAEAFAPISRGARAGTGTDAGATPVLSLSAATLQTAVPVVPHDYMVSVQLVASVAAAPGGVIISQPTYVAAVLDLSASMIGDRLTAARAAIASLLARLDENDTFSLTGFSDEAKAIVPAGRIGLVREAAHRQLGEMRTGATTRLAAALEQVLANLPGESALGGRKVCVLLVSDGRVEDAIEAAAVRAKFPSFVRFSAFGIGTDYDHEFLAKLCGGKERVEHLETPADATHAFDRFLKLEGRTATSGTALRIKLQPDVKLRSVTILRGPRRVTPVGGEVAIDDLSAGQPAMVFVDLVIDPRPPGVSPVADVTLECDLPAHGLSDLTVHRRIEIEATLDTARQVENPVVAGPLRTLQNALAVASAEEDVKRGNLASAVGKLRATTGRLQAAGEKVKAAAIERLTASLERDSDPDRVVKRVWNATQRLADVDPAGSKEQSK